MLRFDSATTPTAARASGSGGRSTGTGAATATPPSATSTAATAIVALDMAPPARPPRPPGRATSLLHGRTRPACQPGSRTRGPPRRAAPTTARVGAALRGGPVWLEPVELHRVVVE